jgi:hypothetical protein
LTVKAFDDQEAVNESHFEKWKDAAKVLCADVLAGRSGICVWPA